MRSSLVLCLALFACVASAQSVWSVPVLETAVNSTAADTSPQLSADDLTLYFASFRSSNWEIYSATRASRTSPWTTPVLEAALGGSATDDNPFITTSGLEIYLASNRAGGVGGFDVMKSTRPSTAAPWGTPTFVTELNSSGSESSPSITGDELEIYMLTTGWGAPATPNNAIAVATRPNTSVPFGTPTIVTGLANANTHRDVHVSADGLTLTYTEFLPSPVSRIQVFRATRVNRSAPFTSSVHLPEFDTVGPSLGVYGAAPSSDGLEMYVAAGYTTAQGSQEILSTRFNGLWHSGYAAITSSMSLNFRDGARPGAPYVLAASLGNTGFNVGSLFVPLDPDFVFTTTLATDIPPFTGGFLGTLGPDGTAFGFAGDPVGALSGLQLYVAGASLDPSTPSGVGLMSSAILIEFQPF